MYLTAIHEIHIGKKPDVYVPGRVFSTTDEIGNDLLRRGAARAPTFEEKVLAGLEKPVDVVAAEAAPAKRGRKPKAAADAGEGEAPEEDGDGIV